MAQLIVTLHLRKRWFFGPALYVLAALLHARILTDFDAAAEWLAKRAMRMEVR